MKMENILRENPHYMLIKEFDLSNRMLKEFKNEVTVVFDNSTKTYKVLSIPNWVSVKVLEAIIIKNEHVNLGLIYKLKAADADMFRNKQNAQYKNRKNFLARHKVDNKELIKEGLNRIKRHRGYEI